jgi:hypothetical protein
MASVPISAIAGSIFATLAPTLTIVSATAIIPLPRPLTEPVGAAAGEVGAGIARGVGGGDRQAYPHRTRWNG